MTFSIKKKTLRKAVASLTMFATVVSMSGMMALSTVVAADAIAEGALIKSDATNPDGTPTYKSLDIYIVKLVEVEGEDTKMFKRLMLNPTVFESYGHLNWGDVQTVSQAVMDEYTTSSLVRVDTDPDEKVYAMAPDGDIGSKSWVNLTTDEFVTDAGSDPDSIYTINAVDGGNYTEVGDITTVTELTTFYSTGNLPDLEPVPAGTGLTLALSAETPAAGTVIADTSSADGAQAMVSMMSVNLTAASDGDVVVDTLKFKRGGIPSADADFSNFYIYDGDTLVSEYTSISSGVLTFSNTSGLFTVVAGTTKTIDFRVDMANGVATSRSVKWSLEDATYASAGSSAISGSFPITGNTFNVVTVADLGQFTIDSLTTYPTAVDPSDTERELWRFNITAVDQNITFDKVMMTMVGTIAASDIIDLRLDVAGTQLGETQQIGSDNTFTFDNLDYSMLSGEIKTVVLYGKVVAGTSRSFKFTVRKLTDVVATDDGYNVSIKANQADTLAIIEPTAGTGTSINAGSLTVTKNVDSVSGSIAKGQNGINLGEFDFKASGEDVKVTTVVVSTALSSADDENLNNGKLYKVDDNDVAVQIGTTTDFDSLITDDADWVDAATDDDTSFSLGNTFIIPAGKTYKLRLVADTKDGSAGDIGTLATEYTLDMAIGGIVATGQVSLSTLTVATASGNQLTLSSYVPVLAENLAMANRTSVNPNGVPGNADVKVGSFKLTAGSTEASITQITLTDDATVTGGVTSLADICQNLRMENTSGDAIGTTVGSLTDTTASTYAYTPSTALSIPANTEYVVDVYCDILSGLTATDAQSADGIVYPSSISYSAGGNSGTITTMTAELQDVYIASGGSLTVAVSGSTPASVILPMGLASASEVARFTFEETSGAEDVDVTKIIVTDTSSYATSLTDVYLDLEGYTGTVSPVSTFSAASNGTITFTLLTPWTVPAGVAKYAKVMAKTAAYGNATANSQHIVNLAAGTTTVYANGQNTVTVTVGSSIQGSAMKIYRTNLTAVVDGGGTGKTRSASDNVMDLTLVAGTQYDAKIRVAVTGDFMEAVSPAGGTHDGYWTEVGAGAMSVNTGTPIAGTNVIRWTADGSTVVATDGPIYTFDTALDLTNYSKLGFWVRSNDASAATSVDGATAWVITLDDTADTTAALSIVAANTWQFVEIDLSTTVANKDGIISIAIDADHAPVASQTLDVDQIRWYNDSIVLDVAGSLNATVSESGGKVWTLKDGATTKATGYYSGTDAVGTVTLIPDSLITIGSTGTTFDVVTSTMTNNMLADAASGIAQSMSVSVDSGSASAAGNFRWYDSAVSATLPITWVTASATTISSSNSYAAGN